MDIGVYAVRFGFVASLTSVVLYALSLRDRRLLRFARLSYAVTAMTVVFCFGRLMFIVSNSVDTGKFAFEYPYKYASPDLESPWKYAATWAGQEGSFLLWALWTAIIGGIVAWKAGRWESRVMPFYISTLVFLFGILIWLSPYNPIGHLLHRGTGPNDFPLDLPWPPTFGQGLNPSLQNYWMAIHPPTIFFGFAALAVPFAYALAAMIWRDYGGALDKSHANGGWAPTVMPYVLMATATLGVGLFMGGYWAYETQGWHGFWGWDPVENASLFPWLGCLGLLHGLIVQKNRGGMGRSNIFLAIASWLLFLWGTFLTRSGVLASFSVHAFDMLGTNALYLLVGMIAFHGLLGMSLLVWRWKSIPGRPISDRALSRDSAMVLAISLMMVSSAVIAVATSWPLISRWPILKAIGLKSLYSATGMPAQPIFYNKFGSVVIIPAMLAMGAVPFLAWGRTNSEKFLWKVLVPWLSAIGIGALVVWFAVGQEATGFKPSTPRILVVVLGMLGAFALLANTLLVKKILRPTADSPAARWTGAIMLIAAGIVVPLLVFYVPLPMVVILFCFAGIAAGLVTLRSKGITAGGWLAHVGIGTMLIGTVLTNVYEKTDTIPLVEGAGPSRPLYGYRLEFAGWTHDDKEKQLAATTDPKEAERLQAELKEEWKKYSHGVLLKVTPDTGKDVVHADDGTTPVAAKSEGGFIAKAPIFLNTQNMSGNSDGPQTMRWPYIHKELTRDYYIGIGNDPQHSRPGATLQPGEEARLTYNYADQQIMNTPYAVRYKNFFMNGGPGQAGTMMGAVVELITPDGKTYEARPAMRLGGPNGPEQVPAQIPEINAVALLNGRVDAATKTATVEFELPDAGPRWIVPVSVTDKPWINLVWLGVAIMGTGTLTAMVRRSLEARKGALVTNDAASGERETEQDESKPVRASIPAVVTAKSDDSHIPAKGARPKPARAKS